MPGITGQSTTYNLPNFVGELFQVTPESTPLLSAIGGLTGGVSVKTVEKEWQFEDLRDSDQNVALEGANAPQGQARVRANATNIAEIHHSAVETSYTKQATPQKTTTAGVAGENPVTSEHDHQVLLELKAIAKDVNHAFWNGEYQKPVDNTTVRKTRGLLQAIATNRVIYGNAEILATAATDTITGTHSLSVGDKVIFTSRGASGAVVIGRVYFVQSVATTVSFKVAATVGGAAIIIGTATGVKVIPVSSAAPTLDTYNTLFQKAYDNGGLGDVVSATIAVNSSQKRNLTATYAAAYGKANPMAGTRNVGGVNLTTIETDFGTLNIMLDRQLPQDALAIVSLEQLAPFFLEVDGKGHFFEEPLAKVGAADRTQIYGEIGLEYGNEKAHAQLRGLPVFA
ncbi:SU10 major capsid protein [Cryobacterium arcticum]|uniref:Uncharacterized protein n=1 Tax=Cryobacterium arcticum TaxID=670052 RepID=A0A1B1BQ77_9MICO|nr:DUF5309 family protein [Cryobacterium arcticum]ANP74533.1 hypothetical protein PA27867_3615 [Cryobacterium arcticum]